MKKLLFCLVLICFAFAVFAQESLPFTKGVNMVTWFESWQEGEIQNLNKYDETDFAMLKSMGVEIVRLPIHFANLMKPVNTGKVMDIVFDKLDQVCDWAEKYQLYLVIDNHSFNSLKEDKNPPSAKVHKEHLEAAWSQIAQRYKDRSEYIIYEILNEPKESAELIAKWYKIQQEIIDVIRTYDTKHTIVVTSPCWSSFDMLKKMKPYKDNNLIYTVHFYEPKMFCGQGTAWLAGPDVKNVPFPYDKSRASEIRYSDQNGFAKLYFQGTYQQEGTAKYIYQTIQKMADWAKKNKVRFWIGEMGSAYWINPSDRLAWMNATVAAFKANNIPYCVWGIDGDTGFLKTGYGFFPDDIDKDALEGYGFALPDSSLIAKANDFHFPQKPYTAFDGICAKGTSMKLGGNFKIEQENKTHSWCLKASYPAKEDAIKMMLSKKITSAFIDNADNLSISLSVKFSSPSQRFELILLDSDGGEDELPWSKGYLIKASDYSVGDWITIKIPVSEFKENGAWSDIRRKWYDPRNEFDWARFESLYFKFPSSTEKGDIYIDDVVIKMK